MLLTVTVPAYNVEKYITTCLDSFIVPDQAGRYEVIVVNDGSTDGTELLARGYEQKHPDIFRVITKENGGHGSAINAGLAAAKGRYFRVVDGDDCVDTGAFRHYLELLSRVDADMVATKFYCCDAQTMQPRSLRGPVTSGGIDDGSYAFDSVSDKLLVRMHSIAWKTDILRGYGIKIDEHSFYVDMEYNMFPVPYIDRIYVSDLAVYKYRLGLGGQSVSLEGLRKHAAEHENVLKRCLEYIGGVKDKISPEKSAYMEKLAAEMAAMQHQIYLSYPASDGKRALAVQLDETLKERYPDVYGANRNKAVKLLRGSGYALYPLARAAVRLLKR